MRYVFILLIITCACSPEWMLRKACKRKPELCQTKTDTTESVTADTSDTIEDIVVPVDSAQTTVSDTVPNIEVKSTRGKATYNRTNGKATLKVICEEVIIRHVRQRIITINKLRTVTESRTLEVRKMPWLLMLVIAILTFLAGLKLRRI